jgi:hypothetical protein
VRSLSAALTKNAQLVEKAQSSRRTQLNEAVVSLEGGVALDSAEGYLRALGPWARALTPIESANRAVSTKYRLQKAGEAFPANFMRHYYDIYCLLTLAEVQEFIGTPAYEARKQQRFRSGDELVATKHAAFLLEDPEERERFSREYRKTSALYYNGQPDLSDILARIQQFIDKM